MDTSMEVSPSGADASVEVAAAAEEAAGSKPEAARQPHAMLASRTYLEKATVEYTVHKLPGMLTRTLAQWGKTSISAALQTRGVASVLCDLRCKRRIRISLRRWCVNSELADIYDCR